MNAIRIKMEGLKENEDGLRRYSPKISPLPYGSGKGVIFLMLFSLPFLGVGIFLVLASLGYTQGQATKIHGPPFVLTCVGAAFSLVGALLFKSSFLTWFKNQKLKPLRRRYAHEPWRWDYKWSRSGVGATGGQTLGSAVFGILIISAIAAVFGYVFLKEKRIPTPVMVMVPAFLIIFYGIAIFNFLKAVKFKGVECKYFSFPYRLGEQAQVEVGGLPDAAVIDKLTIELRCLLSKVETYRQGGKTRSERFYYEKHLLEVQCDPHEVSLGTLRKSLSVPKLENLGTDFSTDEYVFWELRVKAEVPGIDYDFGFILPIYS